MSSVQFCFVLRKYRSMEKNKHNTGYKIPKSNYERIWKSFY